MVERADFHIRTKKALSCKARDLSGLSNREIYELGCRVILEQNENKIDGEVLELHEAIDKVNELTNSVRCRLKNKEVPTEPGPGINDDEELKRNIIPLDLFKEMVLYYMEEYNITNIKDLNIKNRQIFRFVLINSAHHDLSIEDINDLYNSK